MGKQTTMKCCLAAIEHLLCHPRTKSALLLVFDGVTYAILALFWIVAITTHAIMGVIITSCTHETSFAGVLPTDPPVIPASTGSAYINGDDNDDREGARNLQEWGLDGECEGQFFPLCIHDQRKLSRHVEYLIEWENFPSKEDWTWLWATQLHADVGDEFYKSLTSKWNSRKRMHKRIKDQL
jgi:hypothetical protein